jgi:hypothetical protein
MNDAFIQNGTITTAKISTATIDELFGVNATFSGDLNAATGTFTGLLSGGSINIGSGQFVVNSAGNMTANSGTFRGNLDGASGTFAGSLSAASGTFSGDISGSTFVTTAPTSDYVNYVSSTPFGVGNNLFEWYGLKVNGVTWNPSTGQPIPSGMSTVNSKTHKTTTGNVFFGGSFIAGTLSNSTSNTQLALSTIADLGSFGSLGGQISIAASFSYSASTLGAGTCPTGTATSGTLFIERLVGSSWTIVAQVPITGTYNCFQEGPEYISEWNSGGTATYTDNDQNTATRQYRARAVVNGLFGTQRNKFLSIVSTEE